MSDNIDKKVYEAIAKYKDPITNKYINYNDSNINIIIKNKHINVTINIDPTQTEKYSQLIDSIKNCILCCHSSGVCVSLSLKRLCLVGTQIRCK